MDAEARPDDQRQGADPVSVWEAQPGPQASLIACPVFEIFYGGARGGGKTDGMLGDWISHADEYGENAVGLMVRRERTQLIDTIERSKRIYYPLGAKFHEQEKMWRFPNGARLRFAYLERDADAEAYQGHSYTRVYIEELTNFPSPSPVMKMMATLRSAAGVPVGFRGTGNPGGPGHQWVKARYIEPAPMGWKVLTQALENPFTGAVTQRERIYIPSRVTDNHYLGDEYIANLQMSGSATLVKAWLEGDWNVIEGAFFDGWSTERHVVPPFDIPAHWTRIRSFDWGFAKPFSVGWWAVASEPFRRESGGGYVAVGSENDPRGRAGDTGDGAGDGRAARVDHAVREAIHGAAGRNAVIPRGALIRYREWYGASEPNIGLRLVPKDIAAGILGREKDEIITHAVADPSIWAETGAAYGVPGQSIGESLARAGVGFHPADNRRQQGWSQIRQRLQGDADGNPMLFVFDTCHDFIRTVPILQHDMHKPEDLDTEAEDHVADESRYCAMSRPWARPSPQPERPVVDTRVPTLSDLVKRTQQRNARQGQRI